MSVSPVLTEYKCAIDLSLLLDQLIRTIVSDPDAVEILPSTSMDTTVFNVRVSHNDIGKIIGKGGRTARALRTLLAAAGQANQHRFILEIEEHTLD